MLAKVDWDCVEEWLDDVDRNSEVEMDSSDECPVAQKSLRPLRLIFQFPFLEHSII